MKGFTLIETIVTIALIASIMTVLSFGISISYHNYVDSNAYKKESDIDMENIQKPYTNDSTTLKKSVNYTMTTVSDNQSTSLAMYNTSHSDASISLSRFEAQASNFKDAKTFSYYTVDPTSGNLTKITALNNYTISSFEDLPSTNYEALDDMNKAWGPWSFIGWSVTKITKNSDGTVSGDVMSYTDRGKRLYCGNPNYASSKTKYEGVITSENYADVMSAIENGTINLDDYALVPAYFFSQDVPNTTADTRLLMQADQLVRRDMDARNMDNLTKAAVSYIKENGLSEVNSALNTQAQTAIYGNGLELLHFRENGWPQVARKNLLNGHGSRNSSYETSSYYQNQTKIDNGSIWKSGFIYEMFQGIGYDIKETDDENDWLGIHYKYNILMFGDQLKDDGSHPYSLFIQINKEKKTVRLWVGSVNRDGSLTSLGGYYDVTISYA